MKITTEDFAPLSQLVKGYELQPGKHYLFIADGKKFSYDLAHALLKHFREEHPEINVAIIGTTEAKGLDVRETTLADELEALKFAWLHRTSELGFIQAFEPLCNRAIKVLRGEQ